LTHTDAQSPTQAGSTAEGIVWLASYPKSGNTWTRTFLHNLIKILTGENEGGQDINDMNDYTAWDISGAMFSELLGKDARQATREEIAAVRPKVQQKLADETNGLLFVKTHNALVMDRGVPAINSSVTSGAVYIIRNPLDVAISFGHHMGKTTDDAIWQMEQEDLETHVTEKSVYEVYGSWSKHVLSWTRKPNRAIYVMRYEDMLAEPVRTFGALANHLLMTPTRKQLVEAIDLSSFDNLRKQEESEGFKEKPKMAKVFFRTGKADQWRDELSEAQISRIVSAHREQMKRFGYLPNGN
jgi:hypothetical protein